MSWQVVRPQIITLLKTLTTLQEVSNLPKIQFSGYPASHVIPSDNASDYETTAENERQFAWLIRVFDTTKDQGIEKAYTNLEVIVDSILDLIDEEDLKGALRTIGNNLPAKYTYINCFAAPSRWLDFSDEELVMAEITVKVRISVDVT